MFAFTSSCFSIFVEQKNGNFWLLKCDWTPSKSLQCVVSFDIGGNRFIFSALYTPLVRQNTPSQDWSAIDYPLSPIDCCSACQRFLPTRSIQPPQTQSKCLFSYFQCNSIMCKFDYCTKKLFDLPMEIRCAWINTTKLCWNGILLLLFIPREFLE